MIAYLDNSATTQVIEGAAQAAFDVMREGFYNPSAIYLPAVRVMQRVEEVRSRLLSLVSGSGCEVIFTSGGTEANNLAIMGSVQRMRGSQLIASTAVEHPSVIEACASSGAQVIHLRVDKNGEIDLDMLSGALDKGASLISVMQVNNETGKINDIERIYKLIDGRALLHVDGVQGFMKVPFSMKYCDMYSISGHKIHAPKGIGALIVKKGVKLAARNVGGGQERDLRSGTENTPGVIALGEALSFMSKQDMGALMQKKLRFVSRVKELVPDVVINGPAPDEAAPHIVNMSFFPVRGEVMLHALESQGVYVSTGSACSSKKLKVSRVLEAMGIERKIGECALRFSLSPLTTDEELSYAAEKIGEQYNILKGYVRR